MWHTLLAVLLALQVSTAPASEYPAKVIGISDGDTLAVLRGDKTSVKVRLHGIDAPETGQDYGSRSKQSASELTFGKTVTIQPRDVDRYGRTVAVVILPDGRSLNEAQVRHGMAWWYRRYAPADPTLEAAENEARTARRGLWADPRPIPPWEWRQGGGAAPVAPGVVVGNRNSHVYHRPNCPSVVKMKASNRVAIGSAEEAEQQGYRQAADCRWAHKKRQTIP
jgi:endonuclease YncB( thermonuclease family)